MGLRLFLSSPHATRDGGLFRTRGAFAPEFDLSSLERIKKVGPFGVDFFYGGEREIRTLVRVLAVTRFPIVRLQPLGHLSASWYSV